MSDHNSLVIVRPDGSWEKVSYEADQRLVLITPETLEALESAGSPAGLDALKSYGALFTLLVQGIGVLDDVPAAAADADEGRAGGEPPDAPEGSGERAQRVRLGDGKIVRRLADVPLSELVHAWSYRATVPLELEDLEIGAELQAIHMPDTGHVPSVLRVTLHETDPEEDADPLEILVMDEHTQCWEPYGASPRGLYLATVANWVNLSLQWAYGELVRQERIEYTPPALTAVKAQRCDERQWRITHPDQAVSFLKLCGPLGVEIIPATCVHWTMILEGLRGVVTAQSNVTEAAASAIHHWWTRPGLPG